MATARKWSNIQIAMQSALASPVTVTAITKAAEGVCTATNTYSNGDYVFLLAQGMYQLDGRVARVKAVSGSGFTLEGIDTTAFDTFVSGTAEKITFGTSISTATTVSSSGGGFDMIDITTIHDNAKKEMPGLPAVMMLPKMPVPTPLLTARMAPLPTITNPIRGVLELK